MSSQQENIQKVKNSIATKWSDSSCPMCKCRSFGVGESETTLSRLVKNEAYARTDVYKVSTVIPVICCNCGYVMLVSPEVNGIHKSE